MLSRTQMMMIEDRIQRLNKGGMMIVFIRGMSFDYIDGGQLYVEPEDFRGVPFVTYVPYGKFAGKECRDTGELIRYCNQNEIRLVNYPINPEAWEEASAAIEGKPIEGGIIQ